MTEDFETVLNMIKKQNDDIKGLKTVVSKLMDHVKEVKLLINGSSSERSNTDLSSQQTISEHDVVGLHFPFYI